MNNIQKFEWGEIEWLNEPSPNKYISIGIVKLLPYLKMKKHIHFGDNQIFYVTRGCGKQWIDNKFTKIHPGETYHINIGQSHKINNISNEVLEGIIISTSAHYDLRNKFDYDYSYFHFDNSWIHGISDDPVIKKMHESALVAQGIPISVFNYKGDCIVLAHNFPETCKKSCCIDQNIENCELYNMNNLESNHYNSSYADICKNGVLVVNQPLTYMNRFCGFIKAGHILLSSNDSNDSNDIKCNIPLSRINAILYSIGTLGKEILDYLVFKSRNTEFNVNKKLVDNLSKEKVQLEQTLRFHEKSFLNNCITTHFLFNILNSIGALAIEEGSINTYQAIIDLSKLLRYNSRTNQTYITVKEELEFIKSYVSLVQVNLSQQLKTIYDIDDSTLDESIPSNCLQPIVENSFKYAFEKHDENSNFLLSISINRQNEYLVIIIHDNGKGVKDDKLNHINKMLQEPLTAYNHDINESNGLRMIKANLEFYYGSAYDFSFTSDYNKGTTVTIKVPTINSYPS